MRSRSAAIPSSALRTSPASPSPAPPVPLQNKFIAKVMPDADIHTYDGGDQCLQRGARRRIDAYLCDGAEGQSMRDANDGLVLGLLDPLETSDHVGVYRLMAKKGAGFVAALDECIGEMLGGWHHR